MQQRNCDHAKTVPGQRFSLPEPQLATPPCGSASVNLSGHTSIIGLGTTLLLLLLTSYYKLSGLTQHKRILV